MLELTMGGRAVSGLDAIAFLEALPDSIPQKVKTEKFCRDYEYVLNRVRAEVRKSVPVKPTVRKGKYTDYSCGQCGAGVSVTNNYCPKCGRAIDWGHKEARRWRG